MNRILILAALALGALGASAQDTTGDALDDVFEIMTTEVTEPVKLEPFVYGPLKLKLTRELSK